MSKLFEPIRVGTANLSNRIVLAPLTRFRNEDDGVPLPFVKGVFPPCLVTPQNRCFIVLSFLLSPLPQIGSDVMERRPLC